MRSIVLGAFLVGLMPACLLLSPLDEATPDFGYAGSGGKGSGGSAGKGNAGSAGKGNGGSSSGGSSGSSGSAGSGGSGGAAPPPHTCSDPLMIDDMEAPGHTTNYCASDRNGGWYIYSDGTGTVDPPLTPTGGPPFPYTALDTPRGTSTYAAHVSASGQTVYGGGMGVSMHFPDAAYDATAYAGIQFWARGSGSMRVDLSTIQTQENTYGGACVAGALECGDHYNKVIPLTSSWQQYTVEFGEITQNGWGVPAAAFYTDQLLGINFAWSTGATVDYWVDDLRFLEADCDSSTYLSSCPTGTTYQTCWYNLTTTYTCNEYCPMVGFATAPACTDGSCVCGNPLRADCVDGAIFICDCFELAGSPCVTGDLGDLYRGCFRDAQGYEGVSCSAPYALPPDDVNFAYACLDAESLCLQ